MSGFAVAGLTSVSFTAVDDGFRETFDGSLAPRTLEGTVLLGGGSTWTQLWALRSWLVTIRLKQGATLPSIDVAGGAGTGTLTLDNVAGSPFLAVLTSVERGAAYPGNSKLAHTTFTAWLP